jgi:hypothetical protein
MYESGTNMKPVLLVLGIVILQPANSFLRHPNLPDKNIPHIRAPWSKTGCSSNANPPCRNLRIHHGLLRDRNLVRAVYRPGISHTLVFSEESSLHPKEKRLARLFRCQAADQQQVVSDSEAGLSAEEHATSQDEAIQRALDRRQRSRETPLSQKWFKDKQKLITPAQKRALRDLWPMYGVTIRFDDRLNASAMFELRQKTTVLDIGFGTGGGRPIFLFSADCLNVTINL